MSECPSTLRVYSLIIRLTVWRWERRTGQNGESRGQRGGGRWVEEVLSFRQRRNKTRGRFEPRGLVAGVFEDLVSIETTLLPRYDDDHDRDKKAIRPIL